jgi:hypothetical protein
MNYIQTPVSLSSPVDIDRIVDRVRYYSDGKFAFGVLSSGTCFFPAGGDSLERQVTLLLDLVGGTPLDFVVKEMDDHNFLVRFSDKVFSVVFRDEFEAQREFIKQEVSREKTTEKVIGKPGVSPEHLLIGLYARTRLMRDLATREIVRTVEV